MPPRIPYVDPATVSDPELKAYLEDARLRGTPRPESQAVRANHPEILRTFSQTWNAAFKNGVLENRLKELCRVFVSKAIDCEY